MSSSFLVEEWVPGQAPCVVAVVGLREQEGLRLTTNIVGCPPRDVAIGWERWSPPPRWRSPGRDRETSTIIFERR